MSKKGKRLRDEVNTTMKVNRVFCHLAKKKEKAVMKFVRVTKGWSSTVGNNKDETTAGTQHCDATVYCKDDIYDLFEQTGMVRERHSCERRYYFPQLVTTVGAETVEGTGRWAPQDQSAGRAAAPAAR